MRNGFIFKDRHSSDFGVTVRTKSRPILPSVKENIVDLPYRDGGYDFSKANPFGREFYNDRIFTVAFNIYADNLAEMQRKLSLLSLWLCGESELIFDDMPFSKWRGKVSDEVIYICLNTAVVRRLWRCRSGQNRFVNVFLIRKVRLWKCLLC